MKYAQLVCDGDSSSFLHIKNTYGIDSVERVECIPHFKKRGFKHYSDACHNMEVVLYTKKGKEKKARNDKLLQEYRDKIEEDPSIEEPEPILETYVKGDTTNWFPLRGKNNTLQNKIAGRLSNLTIVMMNSQRHSLVDAEIRMSEAVVPFQGTTATI